MLDEADKVDPATLSEQLTSPSKRPTNAKAAAASSVAETSNTDPDAPAVVLPVVTAMAVHKPGKCMVVAYEDGQVSLFPYPSVTRDQEIELCRVASYITRIQFSADNKTVVMIEAGSRAVIQATLSFPSTSPLLMK